MDNIGAIRQLESGLMKSDLWDKMSTSDKVAIRKAITALRNVNHGYWLHEIDNGMPIRYFTKGHIECHKDPCGGGCYIRVGGRNVINVTYGGEHCRGQRGEVIIYDNSIDKKIVDEVITPLLRDNVMLIHDAWDEREAHEVYDEQMTRIKGEDK